MAKQTDQIKGFRLSPKHNERLMRLSELTDLTQTQLVRTLIPPSESWVELVGAEVQRQGADDVFEAMKDLLAAGLRLRMETAGVAAFGASMLWQLGPDSILEAYEAFGVATRARVFNIENPEYRLEAFPDETSWAMQGLAGKLCILHRQERMTDNGIEFVVVDGTAGREAEK